MTINLTTSITVDMDSIEPALFDALLNICYDYIPEFSELTEAQQDEVRDLIWNRITNN